MKKTFFICLIVTLLAGPSALLAQQKKTTARKSAARVEPLRVASGLMQDNRISVRRSDWINEGQRMFDLTLLKADIANGRLQFTGRLQPAGKGKAQTIVATLVSSNARSANPWPGADSQTARTRKPADKRERGEVSEQTQSLYSAAEAGSGCEMMFLKLTPPGQKTPLQAGVVLAHQDNEQGEQINHAVCRIVRALDEKAATDEALTELNQLLSRR